MDSDPDMHGISPDELDDALETLWHGRSGAFERLLNRHGESDAGVDEMFGDVVSQGLPETAADVVPAIANYTIGSELGRGGMGVIYKARQHHPSRDVALKVIRGSHLPDAQQKRLFNREIQSLARLRHPNVADIHEAGVTDDGRPFFAMELVHGKTLSEYASDLPTDTRSQRQRIRTLLGVFEKICDAISYAHQRGVIHRDLKPSNIIVTEPAGGSGSGSLSDMGPGVKVVDFGLARITDPDVAATVTTDAGQIRGTFAYMAPEQIQGDPGDIDIRSDVYALGVLLFEVLTGRLPYDLKHSSVGKVIRIICETAPTRPSTLNTALRGDLETIILKTLSKAPDHRYQSVNAMGEDIARFLTDQPILARPDTFQYRSAMFIRRNKWAVGLASAFVFSLITGLVVTTGLYRDAALARENAESRAAEAEQTAAFFADMLGSVSPGFAKGRDMTIIREVLDRASDEVATELAEFPQAEATLRVTIGNTYRLMGDYDRAAPHLDAALALNIRLHGEDSLEVAEVLHKQAVLAEALGDYDGARELFARQLPIHEHEGDRVGIAEVWSGQARLAYYAGDSAEMLDKAERARDVFLDELGEKDER
ncbi:MAG: serine/threonine protein kinase, partial [Planctomycetes bacterium]|nr:serine/threonine protein kinase [Planctomycetota bacterium]